MILNSFCKLCKIMCRQDDLCSCCLKRRQNIPERKTSELDKSIDDLDTEMKIRGGFPINHLRSIENGPES